MKNIYEVFDEYFGLVKRGNELIFNFENKDVLKRRIDELESNGVKFPQAIENCLHFNYDSKFYEQQESDLSFEVFRLKRALKIYFPNNPLSLPNPFWNLLDVELSKMRLVFRHAALTKMIFAK